MDVKLGVPSTDISWWTSKIPPCPLRRVLDLLLVLWPNSKFCPDSLRRSGNPTRIVLPRHWNCHGSLTCLTAEEGNQTKQEITLIPIMHTIHNSQCFFLLQMNSWSQTAFMLFCFVKPNYVNHLSNALENPLFLLQTASHCCIAHPPPTAMQTAAASFCWFDLD